MFHEYGLTRQPLVSAIIPTYNRAENLVEAVESALAQSYPHREVIVVDDGSTDDTQARLGKYLDNVIYIRQRRRGSSAARNRGMEHSRGELIAFLDADDKWRPEKIQLQVDYLRAHPDIGILCSDAREFTSEGTVSESFFAQFGEVPSDGFVFNTIAETAFPLTSTVMIRRTCIENGARFDEKLLNFQDIDFFMRLNLRCRMGIMKEKLVERRLHPGNVSKNHYRRFYYRTLAFKKILDDGTALTSGQRKRIRRLLAFSCLKVGDCYWDSLDLNEARSWYGRAIRFDHIGADALLHAMLTFLPAEFITSLRGLKARLTRVAEPVSPHCQSD
ncbi:MAG: glycosyltransferase family 2 protein [Candidatus Abyssobacteria bacterium SURF_17]|uniref:Glycosyltransferase family 2 protein n=1 Tax=Candidatus Abyssobacteria bacterium SURF_17 TaxID=2093361 RepID=A0A419F225_9BACT|nr:MAG: glycosyltransferase family 2 protein [Candidatus Abyssubacteria bacterium SURF_17]